MARIRKHRDKWQVLYRDPATKKERSDIENSVHHEIARRTDGQMDH
jgi:hypothetical protein